MELLDDDDDDEDDDDDDDDDDEEEEEVVESESDSSSSSDSEDVESDDGGDWKDFLAVDFRSFACTLVLLSSSSPSSSLSLSLSDELSSSELLRLSLRFLFPRVTAFSDVAAVGATVPSFFKTTLKSVKSCHEQYVNRLSFSTRVLMRAIPGRSNPSN
jgi:hypothetical protein